jgi:hypothetical protein
METNIRCGEFQPVCGFGSDGLCVRQLVRHVTAALNYATFLSLDLEGAGKELSIPMKHCKRSNFCTLLFVMCCVQPISCNSTIV